MTPANHDMIGGDTFTTVARCPSTGRLGVAMATRAPAVGNRCPVIKPGYGAASVQSIADPRLTLLCGRLIEMGFHAGKVVAEMVSSDPHIALRQIAVVDIYGNAEAFTGDQNGKWAGHIVGKQFACIGNGVVSERVVGAMAEAMEKSEGEPLEERLMRSIEAGGAAGGQPDGQHSSCMHMYGLEPFALLDMRVDLHDEPIGELRRLLGYFQPLIPYFEERPYNPRIAREDRWLEAQRRGKAAG
ncbi:MAG: DUF1028 domain-containing protein [Alphaproteobacteria bacterium]|nr:DUF1028 domain-containing protein [Alphaproteobacteria bacterium]